MREILFRGKQIYDDGEWIIGHYACRYGTHYIYFPKTNPYSFDHEFIIPETVGQYTGLTDKNGTKVFEGDIVKVSYTGGFEIGTISWSNLNFRFCFNTPEGFSYGFNVSDEFEVIGNIHDNPELIEGETDNA